MARYFGAIGFADSQAQSAPGVFQDVIVEHQYYGDVLSNIRSLVQAPRRLSPDGEVNDDVTVGNIISIVADAYAVEHYFNMRYILWAGVRWTVETVTVQAPRLLLKMGEVYNGPTPGSTERVGDFDGEPG